MATKKMTPKKMEMPQATFRSLEHWYKEEFEKMGWMILAHNYGMTEKIKNYKHSLDHLKTHLEMKLEDLEDPDKKKDVKIMWDNLMILIKHVNKDFK